MKTRIWLAIGAGVLFSVSALAQAPEVTLMRIDCGRRPTNVPSASPTPSPTRT